MTDATEKVTYLADAKSARQDDTTHCGDVRRARSLVCGALSIGAGSYDPPIEPISWVTADQVIGSEYSPMKDERNGSSRARRTKPLPSRPPTRRRKFKASRFAS